MDNFITQEFRENKKARFDSSNKKLLKNVANLGGDKGTCLFVNRNGEYNGIVIELQERVYPLYLDIYVHSIYLNIESNYTKNLEIIEKFNLSKLYQEYSNDIFRFIVDKFLIFNNCKPLYLDYPKIMNNLKNKDIDRLDDLIRLDPHDLIPCPIKVISTGSLLPEDWIGKIFDSGESFHKAIDNLDSRINKPPVTFLANYYMEYVKEKKIPELTELENLDKLKNVWVQDIKTGKFIQYTNKSKLIPEIKNYIQINCLDESNPLYILFSTSNTFDLSNPTLQSNSIGFNVSLMQKSFRRGIGTLDNLVESIEKLSKTKPYNNPEYQYELVSGSRQLVWRYFISIIEDIQIYSSDKYLDIFDLVIYSYIFHNYPKFIINSNLVTKLIDLGKLLLILNTHVNFRLYPEDNSNKYDLDSRYQISLGISHNYMPGMKGDKKMIRCLLTFIKSKPKLFSIDQLEIKLKDYIKEKEQIKYTDLIYKKIGYYAGLDLHSNPQMIVQVHNSLYSLDKKKSIDLETCSGLIWDTSSSFNYRYHKMKWNKLNDLIYLIQYNWLNSQIDTNTNLLKISDDYTNKLWTGELDLNINLSNLEWKKTNSLIDYNKLIYKQDKKLGKMIKPNHICQILLSSQYKNNFWYKSKNTKPIYTNDQIKFKYTENIVDFESDQELYENIFKMYLEYLKSHSIKIGNNEYKISIETKNDLIKIKINGFECIEINKNKTIEYLDSTYLIVNLDPVYSSNLDLNSTLYKILSSLINCDSNQITTFANYKSIIKLQQKPNYLIKTNLIQNILPEIKQILLSRVLTSLEDKLDRTTLIIGQIDRSGKSNGDSVDSNTEGYLLRLFNIFAVMFGCFHRVSEYKFQIDTKSPVFRYWLESMGYQFVNTFDKKTFEANKEKNKIIKTKLWEHQIKVRDMITGNIIRFNQKGFGDASEVGSGKTLTALSIIEFINNLTPNANYLVLVPNTNLYQVWVDEIKSHCENVSCYTQESDGKWVNSITSIIKDCVGIYVSTMGRNRDNQLTKPINFVIIDECLSVQNKDSKWTIKAFEQVVRAKYGVLMLSATFFRTRFDKLFFMLKMLNTGLPTKSEYLDTILNTAIGANIKTNRIKWETHTNKIKMSNKFYSEYNGNKIADKFESYIKLKKYLNTHVKFQDLVKLKITELVGLGRKILLYVESQTQLEEFEEYVESNKLEWGFYPDITKNVCVLSKHKGTYGINNLVGYNTIVMKPPEPDKLPQIKGRLDRPGQKSLTLYLEYIVIADTIEELDIVKLELSNTFYRGHIVPLANYYDKYC